MTLIFLYFIFYLNIIFFLVHFDYIIQLIILLLFLILIYIIITTKIRYKNFLSSELNLGLPTKKFFFWLNYSKIMTHL